MCSRTLSGFVPLVRTFMLRLAAEAGTSCHLLSLSVLSITTSACERLGAILDWYDCVVDPACMVPLEEGSSVVDIECHREVDDVGEKNKWRPSVGVGERCHGRYAHPPRGCQDAEGIGR